MDFSSKIAINKGWSDGRKSKLSLDDLLMVTIQYMRE
ncbi:mobile genetic element [Streptococcus pneumoniae]|nr:mobile genetic element [Streptococcus pneumoniae]